MNKFLNAKYGLAFFLSLTYLSAATQTQKTSPSDDEFNIFLLTFATVFVCAMIGAAIVGAFVAALFFMSLLAFISFGILSSSVAVALYKRSVTAGFKTFLILGFGIGCAVCGTVLAFLVHHFYPAHLPPAMALIIGLIAGGFGGCIMGLSTFSIIKAFIQNIYRRFLSAS